MEADPIKEDMTQSPANDYSVGIDLGGTQIKAGLVLDNGGIIADLTIPSQANDGAEVVARNIAEAIHSLLDEIQATDRNLNTLIDFRYQQHFKAEKGQDGKGKKKTGKSGKAVSYTHLTLPTNREV